MKMIFEHSLFFGMAVSILAYYIGHKIRQKWNYSFVNPLLISLILIILFLLVSGIPYEHYQQGAQYLTYLLTPATVCLAIPLYKQLQILRKNLLATLLAVLAGIIVHALTIVGVALLFGMDDVFSKSLLAKSVTTAIALGITEELGGTLAITILGVNVAGLMGAVVGPLLLRLFKITDPVAQGLALGSASHAVGTSKAVELGEVQAAMSSLAIVVTGILTVLVAPFVAKVFW